MISYSKIQEFYKFISKSGVESDFYEDFQCWHYVSYTSQFKIHDFGVKLDDREILKMTLTVDIKNPENVLKWSLKHNSVVLDSILTPDECFLTYIDNQMNNTTTQEDLSMIVDKFLNLNIRGR